MKTRMLDSPPCEQRTAQSMCPLPVKLPLMTLWGLGYPSTCGMVHCLLLSSLRMAGGNLGKAPGRIRRISLAAFSQSRALGVCWLRTGAANTRKPKAVINNWRIVRVSGDQNNSRNRHPVCPDYPGVRGRGERRGLSDLLVSVGRLLHSFRSHPLRDTDWRRLSGNLPNVVDRELARQLGEESVGPRRCSTTTRCLAHSNA